MANSSKTKIRKIIKTPDAVYFAGFFDGEGSILIYGRKTITGKARTTPYNLRITITNTHQAVMMWVVDTFGGNLAEYKASRGRARAWKWTALCRDAEYVLKAILPYLIIKKDQAEVALEFQRILSASKTRPYKGRYGQPPLSQQDLDMREALARRLREIRASDKQY